MKRHLFLMLACLLAATTISGKVKVKVKSPSPQADYAASRLQSMEGDYTITLTVSGKGEPEGYTITHKGKKISIIGNDANGVIYGANRLMESVKTNTLDRESIITEAPEMKLRGACVGLQKTVYLPGHRVYEYPYTPENGTALPQCPEGCRILA